MSDFDPIRKDKDDYQDWRVIGHGEWVVLMPCRVVTLRLFEDPEEARTAFNLSRNLGFTCHGQCDEVKWLVDPGPQPLEQRCRNECGLPTRIVVTDGGAGKRMR